MRHRFVSFDANHEHEKDKEKKFMYMRENERQKLEVRRRSIIKVINHAFMTWLFVIYCCMMV